MRYMTNKTDQELLHFIQLGNSNAYEVLYERYVSLVFSLTLQIVSDQALAQEIVQDAFVKVWTHPESYQPNRGRFSSWLLTLTRNTAIDALRKKNRQQRFSLTPPLILNDMVSENLNLSSQLEQNEFSQAIQNSLSHLNPEQYELLDLTYWKGYTLSEVAELKQLPLGTIKSRLHASLKILRRTLQLGKEDFQ